MKLLASVWSGPSHCGHMGSEPVDGGSLFHPNSGFQIYEVNLKKGKVIDAIY